ncbi:hypothetical protein N665_0117s0053, partial [Sinapis alba]
MNNLKKKEIFLSIAKGCEVEVSSKEEGFKGSWFRAILEQDPTKVKGEKLQVCYKTLLNEDSSNSCRESIERCFIRPVPPECLNEGVVFKERSVVDDYFSDGWWNGVVVELSEDMFTTRKLVKVTRKIGEKEDIWDQALILKEIQVSNKRKFMVKRCSSSQHLSDDAEEMTTTVDICKIRSSPPRNLFENYTLAENVEVFVGYGWRKGVVREIHEENQYKVCFKATKEEAVFKNYEIRRLMEWQDGVW